MITLRELGEGLKVKRKSSSNRAMVPFTDGFVCSGSKSQRGREKGKILMISAINYYLLMINVPEEGGGKRKGGGEQVEFLEWAIKRG